MKKLALIMISCLIMAGCQTGQSVESTTTVAHEDETGPVEDQADAVETVDYSNLFNGVDGCAVFYNPSQGYYIYNEEECGTRYSPNSTFKIIAVLEGLRCGVLESEETTMNYSGADYPIDAWNGNLNLQEAFQASCVWYFRQVIDGIGEENMQNALDSLGYGNCDISQWEGVEADTSPDTSGFWLGSSLKISPMEQVNILADIFEGNTDYTADEIAILKNVMTSEYKGVYGKTGTGKDNSAWYVGFYESEGERLYFAVHMQGGETQSIAGADAKGVANEIINQYFI